MSEAEVLTAIDGEGVMTITMNRPHKKNAFTPKGFLALGEALKTAREDDDVSVVLLTGAGNDFTAGVDLTAFGEETEGKQPFEVMMDELCALDKPLIASVNGVGVGLGTTILFHCDIVYISENVRLRMPFANLGLVTEAAACYLAQLNLGPKTAAENRPPDKPP